MTSLTLTNADSLFTDETITAGLDGDVDFTDVTFSVPATATRSTATLLYTDADSVDQTVTATFDVETNKVLPVHTSTETFASFEFTPESREIEEMMLVQLPMRILKH